MGIRFSRIVLLSLFAVALSLIGCDDNEGLSKICPQPIPCAIGSDNSVIIEQPQALGECQFGTLRCDEDGKEYCEGFVGPNDEVCDGRDNNCNGKVDEDFDKDNDGWTSCGGDCNDDDMFIHPGVDELCDNIDQNCNLLIDEGVIRECWTGDPSTMLSLPAICRKGIQECGGGFWLACRGEQGPMEEVCDGLDNDCDGDVDERIVESCGQTDVGACNYGDKVCVDTEQMCVGAVYPTGEVCDGADNDCDGLIDEEIFRPCATLCGTGYELCSTGEWTDCTADTPQPELCDGLDNDCDGEIDEGCPCINGDAAVCRSNIVDNAGNSVQCGFGITICDINGVWGPCRFFGGEPELCNNWDDDCDGSIDGMTQACGDAAFAGVGVCQLGTQTCMSGLWDQCLGDISPQQEICDRLDNDCDGDVDEDLNPHDKVDMIFAIDVSGSMCTYINALVQGISNYINGFIGTEHHFGIVTFPENYSANPRSPGRVVTVPPLSTASDFQSTLFGVTCSGGGLEPSYDIAQMLGNPTDPFGIGWRSDAYPYVIIITDESPQTWTGINQSDIAPLYSNCGIGNCVTGDSIEVFIISQQAYQTTWNMVTYNDSSRYINIHPADPARYTQFLRNIFQNICI